MKESNYEDMTLSYVPAFSNNSLYVYNHLSV